MMSGIIKICTEKKAKDNLKAYEIAVNENIRNVPLAFIPNARPESMALLRGNLLKNGTVLNVRFMNGSATQQKNVITVVKEWEGYANIKFNFLPATDKTTKSDVRIGFKWQGDEGSWSYIGTDIYTIDQKEITCNFGWLEDDTEMEEYRRVAVHEMGHTLGCIHEHQSPAENIPWNKPAVYAYYAKNDGWDKQTVDENIFQKYSTSETQFTAFDTKSIMLYAIPVELTIGGYTVGWNTDLSDTDKSFIGQCYPGSNPNPGPGPNPPSPPGPVVIEPIGIGQTINSSITRAGEDDFYQFTVDDDNTNITTRIKSKFGIIIAMMDSTKKVIAISTSSKHAEIDKVLNKGTYIIRIRHGSHSGKGNYSLTVFRS